MPQVPELSRAVREALDAGRPVVALESTIISHGLPRPGNLGAARSFEALLADSGVTPATIAVIDGVPKVGLSDAELERIALDASVIKVSSRDLGLAMAAKRTAGTTVAATSVLAARAGIRVFATGGLGGVHRGFAETPDESADLSVLSRTPGHRGQRGREVDPGHPGDPGAPGNPRGRGRRVPHEPLPRLLPHRLRPGP